jgi:hypothetical protein
MGHSGSFRVGLNLQNNFTTGSIVGATETHKLGLTDIVIADGIGAGQVNESWSNILTFVASTPQTLDTRSLVGIGSRAVSFAAIKFWQIVLLSSVGSLTVGNAATNAWSAPWSSATVTEVITAGGCVDQQGNLVGTPFCKVRMDATGWVTDATHKDILLTPSAHALTVYIALAGIKV